MRLLIAFFSALLLSLSSAHAADRYEFDKGHTDLMFFINHLGFSDTVGRLTDFDGYFILDEDFPENSKVEITLKPAGIVTASKGLDEHLQKEDFFNVAKYPEAHFVSTSVKRTGDKTANVIGNLTLLGVTRPVTLEVTLNKVGTHPMNGKTIAGFSATGTLIRSQFGMDKYTPNVGDDVRLRFEIEAINQDKTSAKPDSE